MPTAAPDFRNGDEVAYSANFIRSTSLGTGGAATGGRLASVGSAADRRGVVIGPAPDVQHLVYVRWDDEAGYARGVHSDNLVLVQHLHRDAMRVEHAPFSEAAE